jgi:hypothetical protein
MRMTLLLVLGAVVMSIALVLRTSIDASALPRQARCPSDVTALSVRPALVDGVIAAARRVVLDHKTENNQGRITRRTATNFPVLEVVQFSDLPPLPGSSSLLRLATARCGKAVAHWAWAVVFTDTQSPVCCLREVVFVVRIRTGWRVF